MHVYLIEDEEESTIKPGTFANNLSFILEAHILWKRMSKISSLASVDCGP